VKVLLEAHRLCGVKRRPVPRRGPVLRIALAPDVTLSGTPDELDAFLAAARTEIHRVRGNFEATGARGNEINIFALSDRIVSEAIAARLREWRALDPPLDYDGIVEALKGLDIHVTPQVVLGWCHELGLTKSKPPAAHGSWRAELAQVDA
jgi:hypothetical protein